MTEAASRHEFETLFAQDTFDVVLSDFNILGFEGLQVLDLVHAKDAHIPVVIVTGTGSEEVASAALKRGASDYVIKSPRHIHRLPQTIYAALAQKQLETERAKAQEDLRASEAKYRDLVENINAVIYTADAAGAITYISPVVSNLLGRCPEEMVGHALEEFIADPDPSLGSQALKAALRGVSSAGEYHVPTQSGSRVWVRISSRPMLADGAVTGVRGIITDISEKKQSEAVIERQLEHLSALRLVDAAISSSVDLQVTLSILLEQVIAQLNIHAAAVLLLNPKLQELTSTPPGAASAARLYNIPGCAWVKAMPEKPPSNSTWWRSAT